MAYRLLLVEDDSQIREIIEDYFTEKDKGAFLVDCAKNGEEGYEKGMTEEYDAVLLDIMLPEVDGFTLCRELRRKSDVPILFVTARQKENDRLYGYQLGCDDYISKPFFLPELYAKVTALVRRSKGMVREEELKAGLIRLNPRRCTVYVKDGEVLLAPKEYAVLRLLMENKGIAVERETLLLKVWGYDFEGSERVVDNHVKKLRKSLGEASEQIKTLIKRGYRLEDSL